MIINRLKAVLVIAVTSMSWTAHAQQIIDAFTGEPVPYANIQIVGSEHRGTSSAEDGTFRLWEGIADSTMIRISCVGFKPQTLVYTGPEMLILLERVSSELQEVVIKPDESEAARVIRKCVENRARNAPTEYPYFQCILYNKFRADLLPDSSGSSSVLQRMLEKKLEGQTIFFSESAMTYFYEKPDRTTEEIIANRVVGFKTPDFNLLPEQFLPIDLNKDFLDFLGRDYLTPLSKGSEQSYVLHLEDKRIEGADTIWHILFWPQGSQYDLMRGNMVITSDKYALEELRLSNDKRDAVRFDIYHHFKKWQGNWFPDQMFSSIVMADAALGINVLYEQRTFADSVRFEQIPISVRQSNRVYFSDSEKYDVNEIERYRTEPLRYTDSVAIEVVEATADKLKIERKTDIISHLSFGRIPIGPVDIDVYKTLYSNSSEGWRLGTGFVTNDHLSKAFAFGAYFGYGLKDEKWKYGAGIEVNMNKEETIKTFIRYDRNVIPASSYKITDLGTAIASAYYTKGFEDEVAFAFGLRGRVRNWVYQPFFQRRWTSPRFEYAYQSQEDRTLNEFEYSTFGLVIDYLKRKYLPYYNYDIVVTDIFSPHINIQLGYSANHIWDSNIESFRAEFFYTQPIKFKRWGDIEIAVHSGITFGDTPLDLIHVANGTRTDGIPFQTKYSFNTMPPFTYFADRYFNFFYRHYLLRLYVTKYSAPRMSIHQHSGWGGLRNPEDQIGIEVESYQYGYHESGIGLDHILRYNVFSIMHLGFNASAWYRWGHYAGPEFSDNFAWKIGISLGF